MELGEGIKKILLAGIGTAAVTAEKSKEVLDELVKKGELTVEQGKVLNQELKHNIKESVKKNVNVTLKPSNPDELKDVLGKMTPDQFQYHLSEADEQGVDKFNRHRVLFYSVNLLIQTFHIGRSCIIGLQISHCFKALLDAIHAIQLIRYWNRCPYRRCFVCKRQN